MGSVLLTHGQSLEDHLWKDRVLLIVSENPSDVTFRRQVRALRSEKKALEKRVGIVYLVFPHTYGIGLEGEPKRERTPGSILGFEPDAGFGLLLIGLDGGIKYRSRSYVDPKILWELIDAMPMRRAEMKKGHVLRY